MNRPAVAETTDAEAVALGERRVTLLNTPRARLRRLFSHVNGVTVLADAC